MALLFAQLLLIEELEREERHRTRLLRRMVRDAQDPFRASNNEFKKNFRLSKEACLALIEALTPHMQDSVIASRIPKMLRILAALNFYATGNYQTGTGNNYIICLSQSMVSRSIREVSNAILRHLLRVWIKFPHNDAQRNRLKRGFQEHHDMPEVIGIVDGTHVAVVTPQENENIFVNRKGYHSLNCQLICDSTGYILNLVARWPGSTHDAYMWRYSRTGRAMRANFENGDRNTRMMGDSGYPCLPWLLVPVTRVQTPQQAQFNQTFVRCRSIVERCIGLLKGRFRCLLKDRTLHYKPSTAARIVLTCGVLHNIACHYRVEEPQLMWDEIDLEPLPVPQIQEGRNELQERRRGQQYREDYINQYF